MLCRLRVRLLWITLFATCGIGTASGQLIPNPLTGTVPPPSAAKDVTPVEPPLAEKRAANAELLRLAQRKLDDAGSTDSAAAQEVALFKTVEAVLAQQDAVEQQIKDLTARQKDLESQLQSVPTSDTKTSFSFAELDSLKDELNAEQARAKLNATKLAAARAAVEKSQAAFEASEKTRLQAQEAAQAGRDEPNAGELAAALEQARQSSKLATETTNLRKKELRREELAQQVQKLNVQLLQQKVDRIAPRVNFSKADLDDRLAQIKKEEESLESARDKAQTSQQTAHRHLAEARALLEQADSDPAVAKERVEARQLGRDKLDLELQLLNQQRSRLADLRLAWNRRYQLASRPKTQDGKVEGIAADDLKAWQAETKATIDKLVSESRDQIPRISELRNNLATVAKKAEAAKEGSPELTKWLERQRRHLDNMLHLHEGDLVSLESTRRLHERLTAEIGRDVDALSPKQLALSARDTAVDIWNFPLTEIDGNTINVKKVVKGLVIFVVGWVVSRILSSLFAHRVLRRFRMSQDATTAIKALTFYALLVIVTLIALRMVSIPLTAFTILGGALAIGVGFGSQALVGNFISGLIMLAERPVRIGERIVFGKYDGTVEEVGFRSTKVRTLTDHLVTIPNSNLVNEPIENIGRRRTIRRLFNVTITYDTPREKIVQAVDTLRAILEEPGIREPIHPIVGWDKFPPRVYFNDYNAESLNILVVYWFAPPEFFDYLDHCQKVNLRIYEEFERLGVDFAFPSRTLYLAGDSKRELAVRLSSDDEHHAA